MPFAVLKRSSRASVAIVFLSVLALAMAFFASTAVPARGPAPAAPAAAGPLAASVAPTPRNLTFYMHNSTLAKDVNGITTPYIFDTLQSFGQNNTITNLQQVVEDWYLYPALAGDLSVNGSITIDAFISVQGTAPSLQSQTLTIFQVNATGVQTSVASATAGAVPWFNTPHDLVLSIPAVRHVFPAGSSIRVLLSVQLGIRTGSLWYNGSWVPTHLIIESDSFAQVHDLAFLDPTGAPRQNFDPLAANKTIRIQANVTDPLGGYDIHWVNLTLVQPGGAVLLNAVPMAQIAGNPISFASLYQVVWNYSGAATGRYNATATVVDQSGYYHFLEAFSTAGFVDTMDSFFYVGGLPVYVNVEAVDSKTVGLSGAQVTLVSGGVAVDAQVTSSSGIANFTMARGEYTFQVAWQGISVGSLVYNASANVSSASPISIATTVYYPVFQAEDANSAALADASILFVHPNGAKLGPFKTNATGQVLLSQVPGGAYGLEVSWRGVDVYSGTAAVSSNSVITFQAAVYELTVTAKGGNGQALPGAFISVVDSTGLVFDAGVTASDGTVTLRLPAGNYTIDARYITDQSGTLYDSGVRSQNVSLTGSTTATITFSDFPLPFTSTLAFVFALVYAVTIAAFVVVLYLMRRRSKPASAPQPTESKA